MRDISHKVVTFRTAVARSVLRVAPTTIERIRNNEVPKGDPLAVAKVAAIQGAKNTSRIIPYCHQIALEFVGVEYRLTNATIETEVTVKATEKTGVEMEALTGASVAALTIYDMVKMFDETAEIEAVTLLKKTGGKSDFAGRASAKKARAAVLVMSDRVFAGKSSDESGKLIVERLIDKGIEIAEFNVVPDDASEIESSVIRFVDELGVDLVLTTGGTGLSPRDTTPEALVRVFEKELPGVSEAIRVYGQEHNPFAMLSRAVAGVRKQTVIVSLPGAKSAVEDALDVLLPYVLHAIPMLKGECHGHKHGHKAGAHEHEACSHDKEHSAHGHDSHEHGQCSHKHGDDSHKQKQDSGKRKHEGKDHAHLR